MSKLRLRRERQPHQPDRSEGDSFAYGYDALHRLTTETLPNPAPLTRDEPQPAPLSMTRTATSPARRRPTSTSWVVPESYLGRLLPLLTKMDPLMAQMVSTTYDANGNRETELDRPARGTPMSAETLAYYVWIACSASPIRRPANNATLAWDEERQRHRRPRAASSVVSTTMPRRPVEVQDNGLLRSATATTWPRPHPQGRPGRHLCVMPH